LIRVQEKSQEVRAEMALIAWARSSTPRAFMVGLTFTVKAKCVKLPQVVLLDECQGHLLDKNAYITCNKLPGTGFGVYFLIVTINTVRSSLSYGHSQSIR
jgi:hypothetical protein